MYDDDQIMNVTKPTNVLPLPVIDLHIDQEDIDNYFDAIPDCRWKVPYDHIHAACGYCPSYNFDYKCQECDRNMCALCFDETKGIIAEGVRNYHKRKKYIEMCSVHNITPVAAYGSYSCDLCCGSFAGDRYYSIKHHDVCVDCAKTEEGQKLIAKYNMFMTEGVDIMGSIYDWYPLMRDGDDNMVLYNINADAPNGGKYALLSIDNHDRQCIIPVDLSGDELCELLKKYEIEYQNIEDDGWNKFYNRPIKSILNSLDLPYHFG